MQLWTYTDWHRSIFRLFESVTFMDCAEDPVRLNPVQEETRGASEEAMKNGPATPW